MSKTARSAMASAYLLVSPRRGQPAVDDDEAVARLREVGGGRPALQEAAQYIGRYVCNGYPATRLHRLLRAAAGEPVRAPTAREAVVEARQRQLSEQSVAVTFQQLAEQVPALRDLEERVRSRPRSFLRELPPLLRLLGGPTWRGRQFRITLGMTAAVRRLVGPSAGLADPVLSSPSAASAVNRYLWQVAGIDPGAEERSCGR